MSDERPLVVFCLFTRLLTNPKISFAWVTVPYRLQVPLYLRARCDRLPYETFPSLRKRDVAHYIVSVGVHR